MYKHITRYGQSLLITNVNDLLVHKRKCSENCLADNFYYHFFCRIDEDAFVDLYFDYSSQPNVPIIWLFILETLKASIERGDEELYNHFCYDLRERYSLSDHFLNEFVLFKIDNSTLS